MTANHSIDPAQFLSEHLERAEPDVLRSMLQRFIETLMGAEADALAARPTAPVVMSRSTPAMATGPGNGTPAPGPSRLPSPSCAPGPTSPTGCWNGAGGPSGR
jgi:hypothetical protein